MPEIDTSESQRRILAVMADGRARSFFRIQRDCRLPTLKVSNAVFGMVRNGWLDRVEPELVDGHDDATEGYRVTAEGQSQQRATARRRMTA